MNSIVFEECDLQQNWFAFGQKAEDIHRFSQAYSFEGASEVLKDNSFSIEEISLFEWNFGADNKHQDFRKQRKSSEDFWSVCDLKSLNEDSGLLDNQIKPDSISEEISNKKHDGVDSDVNTNWVSQSLSLQQVNSNSYSSTELNESIEVEAKVKLWLNRKDVVIKR